MELIQLLLENVNKALGPAAPIIELVAYGLLLVVLIATFVAKITKTPADDEVVSKAKEWLLKALKYLPTLGVNPQTKKLEEALKDLEEKP